ncbi:hypothetical protein CHU98_g1956 [Xylaria longipes]|nr:hypothetical protein CHU98_g1956 [Xylaria longipes]
MRTLSSWQSVSSDSPSDSPPEDEGWKNELKETIDTIKTYGEFATSEQYSQYANPGLQVGDALVALPLDPAQVALIRNASRQAPFGRGDKTLIDTSVRNTWELDASDFSIANPAWSAFVSQALRSISQGLGMSGVKTELYKLLLYEKGSFFKRHKDSEKAPGMIATLSICLPSRYKGGEVHLSHAGKKHVFDTSQSIFDVSVLAWYADVTHEIKPIVEGHRLVLIYNIIRTSDGAQSADFLANQDRKMQSAIAKLNLHSPVPKRLLYLLDHKYSQASLRLAHLKGRDRAVGHTLQEACTRNGWYLFLCNVTKSRSDVEYGHDYRRYVGYGYYHDNEDEGLSLAIDSVATCSGQIFASNMELDERDILGPDPYSTRDADSESEGEETGNEGAPVEYRYHDSAVIIVPRDQLDQFFDFDVEMKVLLDLVMDDLKASPGDSATREMVTGFLSKAVDMDPTMSPLVLTLAWRMKQDGLFRTAVRAGCKNGGPKAGVINTLVGIVKNAPAGSIDWDKSFGELVSSHRSLTRLSKSLDIAKTLLDQDDLQNSFQQWRSTIELLHFEGSQSLAIDDHDSIMELAAPRWENVGWVRNTLLPKIRDCSDKKLLSKFICTLLQRDREGVLDKAKDVASILLESGMQKLHLARMKFNSMAGDHDDWSECERFCQLLDNCLLSGLRQSVDELLRLSLGTIKNAPRKDDSSVLVSWDRSRVPHRPNLAEKMLCAMCADFEKNKMLPSEPARDFVIAVLKKFVLTYLPKCPRPLRGHSHQPRGCKKCKHCEELDTFLISPNEQEKEFQKGPKISSHLQSQLPTNLFRCTIQSLTHSKKPQCIVKVVKLDREYQAAMEEYKNDLRKVLHKVQSFRSEYMKHILGAAAYGEFVMLDQLPHSGEVEPKNEGGSQVGWKRQAQGGIELPAAKRS